MMNDVMTKWLTMGVWEVAVGCQWSHFCAGSFYGTEMHMRMGGRQNEVCFHRHFHYRPHYHYNHQRGHYNDNVFCPSQTTYPV